MKNKIKKGVGIDMDENRNSQAPSFRVNNKWFLIASLFHGLL